MAEEKIIRSMDQFKNLLAERREKSDLRQVRTEAVTSYNHAQVASQAIKVINALHIDPFVKKVMTLRIMGPMITGRERTHISIALELGATVDDVEQAEAFGIGIVGAMLEKVAMPDFIEKYNREKQINKAVDDLKKSA